MRSLVSKQWKRFSSTNLKERMREQLQGNRQSLKELQQKHGNKTLHPVAVEQICGGMRNIFGLFYETSLLDPKTGITFRGITIQEATEYLPKAKDGPNGEGDEALPEGFIWLLLTGEIPNKQQVAALSQDLRRRQKVPQQVIEFIKTLPEGMHPMTQLSLAILQLQPNSQFAKVVEDPSVNKSDYWMSAYEDSMDLLAQLPVLAAAIYRHSYRHNDIIGADESLDWAGNYAHMLGYNKYEVRECLRGYLSIHCDHEGGNVSAHTAHLVGSALSDPYLAYSSGVNGLAGPLHGLANQEVLKFLIQMRGVIGDNPTPEDIKKYALDTLGSGKVIPGYGHAVLRHTDPRFLHQKAFAERFIKDDPLVGLVQKCYRVIPGVLEALGKVKNPWPNVDAHSGVLLNHYGLSEYEYYTVVFAVSRAIGCLTHLVLARSLQLPVERPMSIDLDNIIKQHARN